MGKEGLSQSVYLNFNFKICLLCAQRTVQHRKFLSCCLLTFKKGKQTCERVCTCPSPPLGQLCQPHLWVNCLKNIITFPEHIQKCNFKSFHGPCNHNDNACYSSDNLSLSSSNDSSWLEMRISSLSSFSNLSWSNTWPNALILEDQQESITLTYGGINHEGDLLKHASEPALEADVAKV
jgi:hypothetical protein